MSAFRKYTREEQDIDTWTNVPRAVVKAAANAREATGLEVPNEKAAVTDGPYHYEDRIRPEICESGSSGRQVGDNKNKRS